MCCPVCECDLKNLNEEQQAEHVETHFTSKYNYWINIKNCMHAPNPLNVRVILLLKHALVRIFELF